MHPDPTSSGTHFFDGQASFESLAETDEAFARIASRDGQGSIVFTQTYEAQARHDAVESDNRRMAGAPRSLLDGVTVSIKDLFDVAGEPTLSGAPALQGEPAATEDAVVVSRLRQAGLVILGKPNMTQFALSCLGLNPALGTPLSPWERARGRIAGGSSSGAAASVADGLATLAVGTDTGGSVRVPAAFCGLVGFKPTARRVNLGGVFSLSTSLDSVGPIARNVAGCAALDAILSGYSDLEAVSRGASPITLGVPAQGLVDDLDDGVAKAFEAALARLERAGVRLVETPMPVLSDLETLAGLGSFSILEGSRTHADLFGRLGDRCDPRVMNRFRDGASTSPAVYAEMQALRRHIIEQFRFDCDAILYPTASIVPPLLESLGNDAAYTATNARIYRNAGVANLLDLCAITLPCHASGSAPVGLTLMGQRDGDRSLLSLAARLERTIAGLH